MHNISIVVADDHTLIRLGLKNIFAKMDGVKLIAEFNNGVDVLNFVLENAPDIAILDVEMPGLNGLNVCKQIKESKVKTKVLFLTMLNEQSVFTKAKLFGANGFLLKDFIVEELFIAIQTIMAGEFYVSEELNVKLSSKVSTLLLEENLKEIISKLTSTEKKVLQLVAINLNSKQIATKLFSSEHTIKTHRKNIAKKLQLSGDQNSLTKFAIQNVNYLD